MATTKKMTKRDYFNALLAIEAVSADDELVDFIQHEIDLLARKNSAIRKPTKKQIEQKNHDADLRTAILAEMQRDRLYSADELAKTLPTLMAEELSGPKVSYLLRELVADGSVVKTEDKRKMFYSLAPLSE